MARKRARTSTDSATTTSPAAKKAVPAAEAKAGAVDEGSGKSMVHEANGQEAAATEELEGQDEEGGEGDSSEEEDENGE